MSNETLFFVLYGFLCSLAGIFTFRAHRLIVAYFDMKRRQKVYPYLRKGTEESLCKGPHSYDETRLVMPQIPTADYLVCKDCGFVSNDVGFFQLNEPALEVHRNNLKLRAEKLERKDELRRKIAVMKDVLMNQLVKNNIQKFDGDMTKNIEELQQFFRKSAMELENMYLNLKDKDLDG